MTEQINWIKVALKQYFPDMDAKGCVDLNRNGKCDPNETPEDFVGNAIPGNDPNDRKDWTEWLSFFMWHREKLADLANQGKLGSIFKWAGRLKGTNPIHINQTVSMLPGKPEQVRKELAQIENTYKLICTVVDSVKTDADIQSKSPREKLEAIYDAMENIGLTSKVLRNPLLHQNTSLVRLDPASSSLIALAVAHEMGWRDVHIVKSPDYIFIRWDDGKTKINMDQGEVKTDEELRKKFRIPQNLLQSMIRKRIYMYNLDRKGYVALALRYVAEAQFRMDDAQTALKTINKALSLDKNYVRAHNLKGVVLKYLGLNGQALQVFLEAKRLNPNYAKAFVNLADAYSNLGDFDKAIESYDEAEKRDPAFPNLNNNRGYAKYLKGYYESADKDFAEELRRNPKSANTYNNRGLNSIARHKPHEALTYFRKALELDKDNSLILFHLGRTCLDLGDFANAAIYLKKAADLDSKSAVIRYNLGIAYHNQKQYSNAIDAYDSAIEKANRNYAAAYFQRGKTKATIDRLDDARIDFVDAKRLDGSREMKSAVESELKTLEARSLELKRQEEERKNRARTERKVIRNLPR